MHLKLKKEKLYNILIMDIFRGSHFCHVIITRHSRDYIESSVLLNSEIGLTPQKFRSEDISLRKAAVSANLKKCKYKPMDLKNIKIRITHDKTHKIDVDQHNDPIKNI